MDIHPWTKYELARLRDEERLLRARDAMRVVELRETRSPALAAEVSERTGSWLDRIRRREVPRERAPVGSGAA